MKYLIYLFAFILVISCNKKESNSYIEINQKMEDFHFENLIASDFLMDDQHSYLGFKIKYFGYSPVRGRFDEFDGTLFYDESNLNSISASVFVNVNSINTGNDRRDDDLKKEDTWFDLDSFPYMHFISNEVLPGENGAFSLVGDLSIKGITQKDTMHFDEPSSMSKDWAGNDQVDFTGRMLINRQDYDVYGGDFWSSILENGLTQLSDEVEIEIEIHCRRADYLARFDDEDSTDTNKMILLLIKADGIEVGIEKIEELYSSNSIRSGNLSSIGYTLNSWKMYEQALVIFNKKMELYPDLNSTWNQLGITFLQLNNYPKARECFQKALQNNPVDSRAFEYLRMIKKIKSES